MSSNKNNHTQDEKGEIKMSTQDRKKLNENCYNNKQEKKSEKTKTRKHNRAKLQEEHDYEFTRDMLSLSMQGLTLL